MAKFKTHDIQPDARRLIARALSEHAAWAQRAAAATLDVPPELAGAIPMDVHRDALLVEAQDCDRLAGMFATAFGANVTLREPE